MTINDIKKAIREIEISYDYNHSKNDYDIVLNLTELANLIKTLQNKAIDDFAEKLKSECREHYIDCDPYFGGIKDSILYEDDIDEIAEQLKRGAENEQSI